MFRSTVLAGWLKKAKRMVSRWLGKADVGAVEVEPVIEKSETVTAAPEVESKVEPEGVVESEAVFEDEAIVESEVIVGPEALVEKHEDEVESEVEAVAPVMETVAKEDEDIAVKEVAEFETQVFVEPEVLVETQTLVEMEMDEQDTMKIDNTMDVDELKAYAEPGIELEETETVGTMTETQVHLEVVEEADAETAAREPQGSRQAERMSLKSRIEAVIYAAEEPVTLAQLGALLAEDVLPYLSVGEDVAAVEANVTEQMAMADPAAEETAQEDHADSGAAAAEVKSAEVKAAEKKAAKEQEKKVKDFVREVVAELMAEYAASERGMDIREVAGGYRMSTKPEYHDTIRAFVKSLKPALKLSLQALETLAVIAYKQPVTAPEISEIRGVDTSGVLGGLMARKLITTAGRKQVIGRPILYKTTRDFLLRFGLKDLSELPSIEEFEKLAGELTELDEVEAPAQGELLIAAEAELETEIDVATEE